MATGIVSGMATKGAAWLGLLLGLLLLAGCSSVSVLVDYDEGAAFDGFERYVWLAPEVGEGAARIYNSPLAVRRVQEAVEAILQARGLRPGSGQAGLGVQLHLQLEPRTELQGYESFVGLGGCLGCSQLGGSVHWTARDYRALVLTLDLVKLPEQALIWRGVGERRADGFSDPAGYRRFTEKMVGAILERLPPQLGRPVEGAP
ncbi:DUF4136 domain-containing protein [Motiliproteus sp. SC1-56]|uniref:DUF4136 domain-containing protein n=1 Tax=Motiliproteus sp. SC1-56 TaxID=2799565 RepID=UPI001A8C3A83|nr:DUF4136 domain-containing protein [Motiliproteus sp. SC1-56]